MNGTTLFLSVAAAIGAFTLASACAGDWSEDFDSYETGSPIIGQSGWTHWDCTSESATAIVTNETAPLSAPNCLRITGAEGPDDIIHQYAGYTSGSWAYSAWQYIPADAEGGVTHFILLNTFVCGGEGDDNWSTQLRCDPDMNVIESEWEGDQLSLKKGQWVEIVINIDLDSDWQWIYYGSELLSTKSWTDGVTGGGQLNIGCVNLYANECPFNVYYDDMYIEEIPAFGACCFLDGTCEEQAQGDCQFYGGYYQGHGSTCDAVTCPELGDCGWIVTAPFTISGDTSDEANDCDLVSTTDARYEIVIPYEDLWTFSVCGAQWDVSLYLGTECCADDLTPPGDPRDPAPLCEIEQYLAPGTYYATIEGFMPPDAGPFTLEVSALCEVECEPYSIPEGEPPCEDGYIDDYDSGCNDDGTYGYPFVTLWNYVTVCGTTGTYETDGQVYRDTDWYEVALGGQQYVTWTGVGEMPLLLLIVDPGDGSCTEGSYSVLGSATADPCVEASVTRIVDSSTDKVWLVATTAVFEGVDCESLYNATVNLGIFGDCPGDVTGDFVVDVLDLLYVLATWGTDDEDADIDDNGVVDVLDLLRVLSDWGPCC